MIDRTKLKYFGGDRMDQIIGYFTGTISVGAPTLAQGKLSVTDPKTHPFGDSVYFRGRFTVDGGATWNDFGAQTPILTGTFPTFQTADCNATSDASAIYIKATSWYDFSNSTSHAYTFQYEVFAIAKNVMAKPIAPIETAQKLSLFTKNNYQKIALANSVAISVASGSTGGPTINYDLKKVPTVRAWFFQGTSPGVCRPLTPDDTLVNYSQITPQITTSSVQFFVDAGSTFGGAPATVGTIEYRIYYD